MSIDFSREFAQPSEAAILVPQRDAMKKLLLPVSVFFLGLFVVDYFFGVDVRKMFEGFINLFVGAFRAIRE